MRFRETRSIGLLIALSTAVSACQGGPQALDSQVLGTDQVLGSGIEVPNLDDPRDPNEIRLALKYVSYVNSKDQPVISEASARQVIARVNELYAPCNIRLELEEYVPVTAADYGLAYGLSYMNQLDPTREQFATHRQLVVINTGSWNHGTMGVANAWTTMPGVNPPGAVLEAPVAKNAEIVAHELGHYLNLDHVSDQANLLNPVIYTTSTYLSEFQCRTMRNAAKAAWPEALR